ncbi:MAG: hypothetical protein DI547_13980 [Sphingobium sp.]|nr:MAG: hypothetical protein DI547_13980 [Sphingobium sp.]
MKNFHLFVCPLAFLLVAATPVQPAPGHRATPISNPGDWISSEDYPPDAMRAELEGTTEFQLEIDKAGIPQHCTIVTSSGSASLDNTACEKLLVRGRFSAAKDANGKPVADTYTGRVSWLLPGDDRTPLSATPYMVRVTFYVNPDGTTSDCVSTLNGSEPGPPDICASQVLNKRYTVENDASGKPVRQKWRLIMGFEKVSDQP